ncbi:MAG: hypothetical protein JSR83_16550 [Proteobacteria bacterium]|nr:hypothetical protein [Pseudomonadota bacterium]
MAISFTPVQLERFRREAKKLGRKLSITHSEALDRIAVEHGFTNWSLLVKHSDAPRALAVTEAPSTPRNARNRFYLHGDVVEGEVGKCYCARCDLFCDLNHFRPTSWHEDGEDGERFLSSLARWNKLTSSEKGRRYRPADAPNVLQQAAEAARTAREASRSMFHKWLESQRDRNDPVGDLAGDVLSDKHFPLDASTLREVEQYLSRYGDHIIRAAQQAWREYQAPHKKTLAQALAGELGISETEAEELVDAEPQERTGHSGEMTYGYLFDFAKHASPKLSAKLLKKRGSLQLEVGPWFFDAVHNQVV